MGIDKHLTYTEEAQELTIQHLTLEIFNGKYKDKGMLTCQFPLSPITFYQQPQKNR